MLAVLLLLLLFGTAALSDEVVTVGNTKIFIIADDIFRITHTPHGGDAPSTRVSLIAKSTFPHTNYTTDETSTTIIVATQRLKAVIEKATEIVTVLDIVTNVVVLQETNTTSFVPITDMGKDTYLIEQSWVSDDDEALFGGGEFQNGLLDFRNAPIQLVQFNTEAIVPFFVTSKGRGILWDNYAWSWLNPAAVASRLNFTSVTPVTAVGARGGVVDDGAGIGLRACDASDWHQLWSFNVSGNGTLSMSNATRGQTHPTGMVMDMNGGHGSVRVWHQDSHFDDNHRWEYDATSKMFKSIAFQTCLTASKDGVTDSINTMECDPTNNNPLQQWELDKATSLVSLSASVIGRTRRVQAQQWQTMSTTDTGVLEGALCLSGDPNELPKKYTNFVPTSDGDHFFYIDACPNSYGCGMGKTLKLWIEGLEDSPIVDWQQLTNLPDSITGRAASLKAGQVYKMYYDWVGWKVAPPVFVRAPSEAGEMTLRSSIGDLVDYYVMWDGSGSMDQAVAGYRRLTGDALLYPLWAYGFWQCKEHYKTQRLVVIVVVVVFLIHSILIFIFDFCSILISFSLSQYYFDFIYFSGLLAAAHGFRNRSIPVDNIVQDWHYWGNLGWGPQWDPAFYPNPAAMVQELYSMNMQLMVSVWSKYDNKTKFFKDMTSKGQMLNGTVYYDAWNSKAREQFYQYSKSAHFDIGVSALWLDATEPEGFPNVDHMTALGSGNALMNSYSLMTTRAIQNGLIRDYSKTMGARLFALTRSSFAGQQGTGAALWSGDISGKWDSMRRQVSASLNYAMSGMPCEFFFLF